MISIRSTVPFARCCSIMFPPRVTRAAPSQPGGLSPLFCSIRWTTTFPVRNGRTPTSSHLQPATRPWASIRFGPCGTKRSGLPRRSFCPRRSVSGSGWRTCSVSDGIPLRKRPFSKSSAPKSWTAIRPRRHRLCVLRPEHPASVWGVPSAWLWARWITMEKRRRGFTSSKGRGG